jgi:hypothetical protein
MSAIYTESHLFLRDCSGLRCMVSCRMCGKNLDGEDAADHMKNHDKRGEIPHIRSESTEYNKRD